MCDYVERQLILLEYNIVFIGNFINTRHVFNFLNWVSVKSKLTSIDLYDGTQVNNVVLSTCLIFSRGCITRNSRGVTVRMVLEY